MYEIKVSGMTCNGCVKSVTNALKAVDEKARVDVDLASQTVKIDSTHPQEKMLNAILDAGFGVVSSSQR